MPVVQTLGLGLRSILNRLSSRWLLLLFSAVFRALKRSTVADVGSASPKTFQVAGVSDFGESSDAHEHRTGRLDTSFFSASFLSTGTALHPNPYRYSGPKASRSSQDIRTMPIHESYLLRNLSVPNLHPRPPSPQIRIPSPVSPSNDAAESIRAPGTVAMDPIQYLRDADPTRRLEPGTPEAVDGDRHNRRILM